MVDGYIGDLMAGNPQPFAPGATDYLNPDTSSQRALAQWGNAVVGQGVQAGGQYYGNAPGRVNISGIPTGDLSDFQDVSRQQVGIGLGMKGPLAADAIDRADERGASTYARMAGLPPVDHAEYTPSPLRSLDPIGLSIRGVNGVLDAGKQLGSLLSDALAGAKIPSAPPAHPFTPTPDSAYGMTAPVGAVESSPLAPPSAPSFSPPAHPSTPTPTNSDNLGGLLGTLGRGFFGSPPSTQSTATQSVAPSQGDFRAPPPSTSAAQAIAPGAYQNATLASAAQDAFSGAMPSEPSYRTVKVDNPAYASAMAAYQDKLANYNALENANVPSLATDVTLGSVTPGSFDTAFGAPPAPKPAMAKPVAPSIPKFITKQVPVAPPVQQLPALPAPINVRTMPVAAVPAMQSGTLGSVLGSVIGGGIVSSNPMVNPTGGGNYTSNSKAYGPTTYGVGSYFGSGSGQSTLGGGDGHRAL